MRHKNRQFVLTMAILMLLCACGGRQDLPSPEEVSGEPEPVVRELPESAGQPEIPPEILPEEPETMERFDRADQMVQGLTLGMTREQAREALGEPLETAEDEDDPIVGEHSDWMYDGMRLTFYDIYGEGQQVLAGVQIEGEQIPLTNGLRVGYTEEEVLSCWYDDGQARPLNTEAVEGFFLYGEYLYASGYTFPERYEQSGYVTQPYGQDGDSYITYSCYTPALRYMEETDLMFHIGDDGTVTDIRWERALY